MKIPTVQHLLIDLHDCNHLINNEAVVRIVIGEVVDAVGAKLLDVRTHVFDPQGLTAFALLSESHFSIHSWPEIAYAAVDLLTCGDAVRPSAAIDVLRRHFAPKHIKVEHFFRTGDGLSRHASSHFSSDRLQDVESG